MAWPENQDGVEMTPEGVIFHVGAQSYRVNKVSTAQLAEDYLAVEQHLLGSRKGPIESVLPEVERLAAFPHLQEKLIDRAYKELRQSDRQKKLTNSEIGEWMDTLPGVIFMMGLSIRRLQPDVTDGDIMELVSRTGAAEMRKARDAIAKDSLQRVVPGLKADA